jgi:hypothetical protein
MKSRRENRRGNPVLITVVAARHFHAERPENLILPPGRAALRAGNPFRLASWIRNRR